MTTQPSSLMYARLKQKIINIRGNTRHLGGPTYNYLKTTFKYHRDAGNLTLSEFTLLDDELEALWKYVKKRGPSAKQMIARKRNWELYKTHGWANKAKHHIKDPVIRALIEQLVSDDLRGRGALPLKTHRKERQGTDYADFHGLRICNDRYRLELRFRQSGLD